MPNLQKWEGKIKNKKISNSFGKYCKELLSWYPIVLYKQNNLISSYPTTDRSCPVISQKQFEESRDDLIKKGLEYELEKSFFDNFERLFKSTDFSALFNYGGSENSDYAFSVYNSINCYLSFSVITDCENIAYSFAVKEGCKNIFNSVQITNNSENVYLSRCVFNGFNIFYSNFIEKCDNIWFSDNLIGCSECIFCSGLHNKSYYIKNVEYSRDEYIKFKNNILKDKNSFHTNYLNVNSNGKNNGSTNAENSNFVINSENVLNAKYCFYLKNAKNAVIVGSPNINENMFDTFEAGALGNKNFYGAMNAGVNSENLFNCEGIVTSFNIYYSRFLESCSFCIGCIGLKNKSFCILNKQYTKEEWYEISDKIFESMDNDNTLGDFFPGRINPFYFNDTIASLLNDNFSKQEVIDDGYMWRDEKIKVDIPDNIEIVEVNNLVKFQGFSNDGTWRINPEILDKVIKDLDGNIYKIVKMEYDFLIKHKLPLPLIHWLDRIQLGFK